jgi:alpha-glucosidase (family GH31 glycosyl hydrolase)
VWIENRPRESVMDRYFWAYDKDYKKAFKALTAISGKVPLPRKYAMRAWYCRWWDYSADEYRQIVKEYKDHDFPLDIMVFDMVRHTQEDAIEGTEHAQRRGWAGYSCNKELFTNPEKLIKEFKDENIYVALNDHPHDGINYNLKKNKNTFSNV